MTADRETPSASALASSAASNSALNRTGTAFVEAMPEPSICIHPTPGVYAAAPACIQPRRLPFRPRLIPGERPAPSVSTAASGSVGAGASGPGSLDSLEVQGTEVGGVDPCGAEEGRAGAESPAAALPPAEAPRVGLAAGETFRTLGALVRAWERVGFDLGGTFGRNHGLDRAIAHNLQGWSQSATYCEHSGRWTVEALRPVLDFEPLRAPDRWASAWYAGRVLGTAERHRVYDKESAPWRFFTPDGREVAAGALPAIFRHVRGLAAQADCLAAALEA